jgi:hypothetical protein
VTLLLDHILVADRKIHTCVFSCLMLTMTGYNTYRHETSMVHEPHTIAGTPPPAGRSILSSWPTYDGIGADEYIE